MPQNRNFANAVVIGASGGIGAALVKILAGDAAERVHSLSRSPGPASSPRIITGRIDILDEVSIAAAAASVAAERPADLVIVATGLLHAENIRPEKAVRDLSGAALADYFAVNATGPALVAKYFLPIMPRTRRAVFACLSARVGSIGDNSLGGWYGYRASKAALNMLVKTLAIEVARTRPETICVALHPGTVDTPLSAPFQKGVPAERMFTPDFAAASLLLVIAGLTAEDSGGCFAWDGTRIVP